MKAFPSAAIRWTSAGTMFSQASGLLRLVLVSTVVSVEDIGRYAIAVALSASAGLLGDSGLRQLYLSRRADAVGLDPEALLGTTWGGMAAIQAFVVLATVPLGVAYARFATAGDWTVVAMAIAVSGSGLLATLQNPAILAAERDGQFAPGMKAESLGQIAGLLLVCVLLREWPSPWLLVAGQAAAALVACVASWRLAPGVARVRVDLRAALRLARAGRPFLWISATTYVTASLDKLLIGLMLSPSAAGALFLAQRIADAPRQLHASVLGRTILPHYASSHATHGHAGVLAATRSYLGATAGVFVLAFAGIAAAWGLYEAGLLGRKWLAISWILPVLLVGTGFRAACHVMSPALVVVGSVEVEARLKLQEGIAYLVALPVAIHAAGLAGAALAFTSIYAVALARRYRAVRRETSPREATAR